MDDPLNPDRLIEHVQDAPYFDVPRLLGGTLELPQIRESTEPIFQLHTGIKQLDQIVAPLDLQLTKFMVIEVLAAVMLAIAFIGLAHRMARSDRPQGRLWNLLETMLVFIRDNVARPAIGHDADRYLPFLWTLAFFVLTCNLLGLVPWLGSPTGAFATTGALALMTLVAVVGSGMSKLGVAKFWKSQVPPMELPLPLAIFLKPMVFCIEVLGLLIRHFVLSVRLLANMLAGHLVLAVLLAFIAVAWHSPAIIGVAPASLLGATALNLLELFVAFLQAYIFVFLAALFIGMAVHPH